MARPLWEAGSDGQAWTSRSASADTLERARLLLVCDYRPHEARTVIDHIEAIRDRSRSSVYILPTFGDLPDGLDLEAFDGLLVHYNVKMAENTYLSPLARWRIRQYSGVKAAFLQDEYRSVDETVGVMRILGIQVLFSCVPSDEAEKVYPRASLPELQRIENVLTGYVPDALLTATTVPWEQRTIDVGYRGRRLPAWLGELSQEKVAIADKFVRDAPAHGLTTDISCDESERLYGSAWNDFIGKCKAMLGVESGASVFDFDGSIEASVRRHLTAHPRTPFEELQRLYFADAEGRIRLNQISPRSFEAAALGTLMILYPGAYSGILQPWRHYVPLKKDHSNMAEVVGVIRDHARWSEITRRAREEVALNPSYSYQAMVDIVDEAMNLKTMGRARIGHSTFARFASHSFAAMRETKLHAGRLPTPVNRAGLRAQRAAQLIIPSATEVAPSVKHSSEKLHWLRHAARHFAAFTYWSARPHRLPWRSLVRGGSTLLEELAELRLVQDTGRRAMATAGMSPYGLLLDREAHEIRVVIWRDMPVSANVVEELPLDLSWAKEIRVDFDDRWLVPIDLPEHLHRTLEALSVVLRARPDVCRRLVAGDGPWCAVTVAQPL